MCLELKKNYVLRIIILVKHSKNLSEFELHLYLRESTLFKSEPEPSYLITRALKEQS